MAKFWHRDAVHDVEYEGRQTYFHHLYGSEQVKSLESHHTVYQSTLCSLWHCVIIEKMKQWRA